MQNHHMALKKRENVLSIEKIIVFYIPTDEDKVGNGETRLYSKTTKEIMGGKNKNINFEF